MNAARTIWLVFAREFKSRMLTRANIISLSIMLALIAGGSVVGSYFLNREDGPPTIHVGVDAAATAYRPYLEDAADEAAAVLDLQSLTEEDARAILAGDVAGAGPLNAFVGGAENPTVIVADPNDGTTQGIVFGAVQAKAFDEAVRAIGGDPERLAQELAGAQPTVEYTGLTDEQKYGPAYGVSMVGLMLLLIVLVTTGSMIAMGVVEEKTSRVVEILLATIRPTHLLAGKILGVGAFGLFQVTVLGGAMTTALYSLGLTKDIDVSVGGTLALIILWFILGYTIFSLLFGALASLVSRYEDIGAVTTPLSILVLVPFYTSIFLVPEQPDSGLVQGLSQVPFLSPFMMPIRNAMGSVTAWEMVSAVLLSLLTIPALVWVAARMYQRGVLHMGSRLKLTEALRLK